MKRFVIFALLCAPAFATCSGSGLVWSCTAGSTVSQIQSAYNSATDGAVITLANGSYSVASAITITNTKGATFICASVGGCTINSSGGTTVFSGLNMDGTNTHFYRFSGFVFDAGGVTTFAIIDLTDSLGGTALMLGPNGLGGIRIDHNTFQNMPAGSNAIVFGDSASNGYYFGVADHNTVNVLNGIVFVQWIGNNPPAAVYAHLGTVNNFFIEDNNITFVNNPNPSQVACTDGWAGASYVARHNTSVNCLWASHGVTHGGGPDNYEFYSNDVSTNANATGENPGCYRCFHDQGSGTAMLYSNNLHSNTTPADGEAISMLHYRDYGPPPSPNGSIDNGLPFCDGTQGIDGNRSPTATNRGYPCWRQPGRDGQGNIHPVYAWNNIWTNDNSRLDASIADGAYGTPDYYPNHMQNGRDWFVAGGLVQTSSTSPFNGTSGMGFGTLANRPTTCTANATVTAENGLGAGTTGLGYFATDVGAQGTLYKCTATNTWTADYQPYTYPHPLVGGGSSTYNITVSSIVGHGTVSDSQSLIVCPGACSTTSALGSDTFTATPDPGYSFTSWGGGACSGSGSCVVSGPGPVTITATFTANANVPVSTPILLGALSKWQLSHLF